MGVFHRRKPGPPVFLYATALLACAATALLCLPLAEKLALANIIMLFLLDVALIAAFIGRGPAILAAFTSVALFDLLFVPPRFSFTVNDSQYLVTFIVMLAVALLISHFVSRLQEQLELTRKQQQQTGALYGYARLLAGAIERQQVLDALQRCLQQALPVEATAASCQLLLPDEREALDVSMLTHGDQMLARLVYQQGVTQRGEVNLDKRDQALYLPLLGSTRIRGVLAISLPLSISARNETDLEFFTALASLTTTAIERLHFVDVARVTELQMQSEKLRSSILSSLSHDIRTPLTALCGLADTLKLTEQQLSTQGNELVDALRKQALQLHHMVNNLLDMARLQGGHVSLRREWQPLAEVIGSSLHALAPALQQRTVQVRITDNMPLLELDPVLMERVFCNLLENAVKYSPTGSAITITATASAADAVIVVHNDGSGFPADTAALLDVFQRGSTETSVPGFGLGLAICRSIVEAHGGTIRVYNPDQDGASVEIRIPLGTPPALPGAQP